VRRAALISLSVTVVAAVAAAPFAIAGTPKAAYAATILPKAGGEPNVTISPSGRTVLADGLGGGNGPADLYRSTDFGKHFTRTAIKVPNVGGGDWDMHFINEKTVIGVDLDLTAGLYVDVSKDAGLTWTQSKIQSDVYDRPWVAGKGKDVYVVAKGFDGIPYLYISHDTGATFGTTPVPLYGTGVVPAEAGGTSPNPAEAFVTNQDAYVDNLTVDPKTGDVFVLYGIDPPSTYSPTKPLGVPARVYVAHLEGTEGATPTMVSHPVYLGGSGDAFYAGFNWMALDQAHTLYVTANGLHNGHQSAWLSYSKDHGKTWSKLVDVGTPGKASVYAAIAGGAKGTLAMNYYEGTGTDPNVAQNWYATMVNITAADTAKPKVTRTRVLAKPVHTKDICLDGILCGIPGFGDNRDLLDYIDVAIAPDGSAIAVFASDGPASADASSGTSTIVVRQTAGPKHGKGVDGT
jgi:hypothetical protein